MGARQSVEQAAVDVVTDAEVDHANLARVGLFALGDELGFVGFADSRQAVGQKQHVAGPSAFWNCARPVLSALPMFVPPPA